MAKAELEIVLIDGAGAPSPPSVAPPVITDGAQAHPGPTEPPKPDQPAHNKPGDPKPKHHEQDPAEHLKAATVKLGLEAGKELAHALGAGEITTASLELVHVFRELSEVIGAAKQVAAGPATPPTFTKPPDPFLGTEEDGSPAGPATKPHKGDTDDISGLGKASQALVDELGPPPVPPDPTGAGSLADSAQAVKAKGDATKAAAIGAAAGTPASGATSSGVASAAAGGEASSLLAAAAPVAIFAAAVAAGAIAVKVFTGTISEQVKELEGYSTEVAIANARAEVQREMNAMHRAHEIGPEIAAGQDAITHLETAIDGIGTELLKILSSFAPLLEMLADLIRSLKPLLEVIATVISEIMKLIQPIVRAVDKLVDWFVGEDDDDDLLAEDPFFKQMLSPLNPGPAPPGQPPAHP